MSTSRSRRGCHTCKVRKKKCDETRPFCVTCTSRGIPCYGYGAKPDWLTEPGRDMAQIKEVREIKKAAERNYKARRAQGTSAAAALAFSRGESVENLLLDEKPKSLGSERALVNSNPVSPWYQEKDDSWSGSSASEEEYSNAIDIRALTRESSPIDSIWWDNSFTSTFGIKNVGEAAYLLLYLRAIFPLQFGFCSPDHQSPSWFVDLLSRSKPIYHGALSVSAYYSSMLQEGVTMGGIEVTDEVKRFNSLALIGTQRQIDTISSFGGQELLRAGFETLASMIQLLSLEAFTSLGGTWELHLNAARTLLSVVDSKSANALIWAEKSHLFSGHPSSSFISTFLSDRKTASTPDGLALKFFMSTFVWIDVIAYSTFDGPSIEPNSLNYLHLLLDNTIQLRDLMGCDNWVIFLIAKIAHLKRSKREAVEAGTLSIPELALQAASFEQRLKSGLLYLLSTRSATPSLERDRTFVTEMYARAALVYLHTTVSGPHASVPEISASVCEFILALQAMPVRLLFRISWPFCIAGCMASEENENIFRSVTRSALETGEQAGTVWKGMLVMEECWRLRKLPDRGSLGSDWMAAMESMGLRIMLV